MRQRKVFMMGVIGLLASFVLIGGTALAGSLPAPEGMFELYEQNRTQGIPNYITEDFILLAYCMILNETVTGLEETVLYPEFQGLINEMIKKLKAQKAQDDVTGANLDYLNVLACLLSGKETAGVSKAVTDELKRIREAKEIALSDMMKQKIDYSQFRVRGKYSRTKKLARYFQAMKYAGTVLFPVLESRATGITAEQADFLTGQALALVRLIHGDKSLLKRCQTVESSFSRVFGPPDDLTREDYSDVASKLKKAELPQIRKALLEHARKTGRQPAILSGFVDVKALEKGVKSEDVLTGWRLMPQRFTPDSAAFQQLVYDQVKTYKGKKKPFSLSVIGDKPVKGFPSGLELMALLGSEEAGRRLDESDERNYEGYEKAASEAGKILSQPSGMSSDHLGMLEYWLNRGRTSDLKGGESRRLNTCLAFWTYNRYISILYTKQSYTAAAKSFTLPDERETAWLEPAAELYLHLQNQVGSLISEMREGDYQKRLNAFLTVLRRCHDISSAEIRKTPLKKEDIAFLNDLDAVLLRMIGAKDQPIVVDVHTEPNSGQVLEEGLGYPESVEKEINGKKARGALFRYYEFRHPMKDRLTGEKWRLILTDPKAMEKLRLSPGSVK